MVKAYVRAKMGEMCLSVAGTGLATMEGRRGRRVKRETRGNCMFVT